MKSKVGERPEFWNDMTESLLFRFPVTVYYEDTDITGVVYHANYLKYCERARSEILGAERLYQIHQQENLSFVVYRAEMNLRRGAVLCLLDPAKNAPTHHRLVSTLALVAGPGGINRLRAFLLDPTP